MNVEDKLKAILAAIQQDAGNRGLGRDPEANLFNACPDDFSAAPAAAWPSDQPPMLGVVTGFWIPAASLGETDGPLGAVYLARTLPDLGVRVLMPLVAATGCPELRTGGRCWRQVRLIELPRKEDDCATSVSS